MTNFGVVTLKREGAVVNASTGEELSGEDLKAHLREEKKRLRLEEKAIALCRAAGHTDPYVEVFCGEPIKHMTPNGIAYSSPWQLVPLWSMFVDMARALK